MTVVVCHCVHRKLIGNERLQRLRLALAASAQRCVDVGDVCAAAASGDAVLAQALAEPDAVLCGCHARALQALAQRLTNAPLPGLRTVDLRDLGAPDPVAALGLTPPGVGPTPVEADLAPSPDAWFPVLDATRCVDCGQCQSFCLFGVYARSAAGRVLVQQPLHCKTDCPACARVCPENAIIFPKCTDAAINGASLTAEQLRTARIRLRPDEVFGGDLRAKLAARRAAAGRPLFRPGVFPAAADGGQAPPPGGSAP